MQAAEQEARPYLAAALEQLLLVQALEALPFLAEPALRQVLAEQAAD